MTYKILVSPLAKQDIIETADYIREHGSPTRAVRWKDGLLTAIRSLDEMPSRCSIADESAELGWQLRELHYKSHRIIFDVDEAVQTVRILRVYHSARSELNMNELE